MGKYKQSNVTGESWVRSHRIIIDNNRNTPPSIRFDEEEIVAMGDGKVVRVPKGTSVESVFTPIKATHTFPVIHPVTSEYMGFDASYMEVFALIYSLYWHLANERDHEPKPYDSWKWNYALEVWEAPIPMPDDGQEYVWHEGETQWVVIPSTETDGV